MNARDERSFSRLDRAVGVLGPRGSVRVHLTNPPPMYERFFVKLQNSVVRLRELKYEQHTLMPQHAVEGLKTAYLRKRMRREYMIPLTRIGRRLFRFAPEVERALKVPHARASHRELVTSAEVMLKAVQPHRKRLVEAGFSTTFLGELRDLTRELKRIATTSSARQAKFARVSRALHEELATANETLRILDGLVMARADHDPRFAKEWKDVWRIPKRLGRPPKKKPKRTRDELATSGSTEELPTS